MTPNTRCPGWEPSPPHPHLGCLILTKECPSASPSHISKWPPQSPSLCPSSPLGTSAHSSRCSTGDSTAVLCLEWTVPPRTGKGGLLSSLNNQGHSLGPQRQSSQNEPDPLQSSASKPSIPGPPGLDTCLSPHPGWASERTEGSRPSGEPPRRNIRVSDSEPAAGSGSLCLDVAHLPLSCRAYTPPLGALSLDFAIPQDYKILSTPRSIITALTI